MVENFEAKLRDYAQLLAKVAINPKDGQKVVLQCDVSTSNLAHMIIDALYDAGASDVIMSWVDEHEFRQRLLRGDDNAINNVPAYYNALFDSYCKDGAANLRVSCENPYLSDGIEPSRFFNYLKNVEATLKGFRKKQNKNEIIWNLCRAANKGWAKKVFPNLDEDDALDKLWDALFACCRIKGDGKVVEYWDQHVTNLREYSKKLNEYNFKTLHYKNNLGTDFTIDLPTKHIWTASCENKTKDGKPFIANIPTEEVFTSPLKDSGNGVIYASKPLVLRSTVVNDIRFEVENGKIVDATSSSGQDVLRSVLAEHPGNSYFGEVAIVPHDSAISNLNILFFDTLLDENAACHIAFGKSYPKCFENGLHMTQEELEKEGLNFAGVHEDFMIGTSDLNIVGTTWDGQEIPFFTNGTFTF